MSDLKKIKQIIDDTYNNSISIKEHEDYLFFKEFLDNNDIYHLPFDKHEFVGLSPDVFSKKILLNFAEYLLTVSPITIVELNLQDKIINVFKNYNDIKIDLLNNYTLSKILSIISDVNCCECFLYIDDDSEIENKKFFVNEFIIPLLKQVNLSLNNKNKFYEPYYCKYLEINNFDLYKEIENIGVNKNLVNEYEESYFYHYIYKNNYKDNDFVNRFFEYNKEFLFGDKKHDFLNIEINKRKLIYNLIKFDNPNGLKLILNNLNESSHQDFFQSVFYHMKTELKDMNIDYNDYIENENDLYLYFNILKNMSFNHLVSEARGRLIIEFMYFVSDKSNLKYLKGEDIPQDLIDGILNNIKEIFLNYDNNDDKGINHNAYVFINLLMELTYLPLDKNVIYNCFSNNLSKFLEKHIIDIFDIYYNQSKKTYLYKSEAESELIIYGIKTKAYNYLNLMNMFSYHSKIFEKKYPQLTGDIKQNLKIENVFNLFKDFSKHKMMIEYLLNLLRNKYDIHNVFDINEIKNVTIPFSIEKILEKKQKNDSQSMSVSYIYNLINIEECDIQESVKFIMTFFEKNNLNQFINIINVMSNISELDTLIDFDLNINKCNLLLFNLFLNSCEFFETDFINENIKCVKKEFKSIDVYVFNNMIEKLKRILSDYSLKNNDAFVYFDTIKLYENIYFKNENSNNKKIAYNNIKV